MIRRNSFRGPAGMSLIELAVALVIIGIAIAGITELTFINGLWTIQSLNKTDNLYSAKTFLDRIGFDIRQSRGLISGNAQTIQLNRYSDSAGDTNDGTTNGFPSAAQLAQVSYKVIPNASSSEADYMVQSSTDAGANWTTVLTNVVGPVGSDGLPAIFQYVDGAAPAGEPNNGVSSVPSGTTSSVVVNLELRRTPFGSSEPNQAKNSLAGIRSEFFLRNFLVRR